MTVKKPASKKAVAEKAKTTARRATSKGTTVKRGDAILIDSAHVGSPRREGEVLKVVRGELSVSYWVRWSDGHESFITPKSEGVQITDRRT